METETPSGHHRTESVPLARIGGDLRNSFGWSATAFPLLFDKDTLLVTPRHVLDGAGTSNLLAISNEHVIDENKHPIDMANWRISKTHDLAVARLHPEEVAPWKAQWPAFSDTADLSKVHADEALVVHVTAMPRPLPGASTKRAPVRGGVGGGLGFIELTGEYVLPCINEEGASGSPVFVSDGPDFGFAGIVTSAITDGKTTIGTVVLPALVIEDFIRSEFA